MALRSALRVLSTRRSVFMGQPVFGQWTDSSLFADSDNPYLLTRGKSRPGGRPDAGSQRGGPRRLPEPALLEGGAAGADDVLPLGGGDQGGVGGQVLFHLVEGELLDVGNGRPGAFEPAALDGAAGKARRIQPVVHPRVLGRDHRAEIAVAVEPGLGAVEAAVVVVPVGGFVEV